MTTKLTKLYFLKATLLLILTPIAQAQIQFEEVAGTPFDGVYYSSIAFSDVDGDGDQDILITGRISSSQRIAKLFTNDGSLVVKAKAETIEELQALWSKP